MTLTLTLTLTLLSPTNPYRYRRHMEWVLEFGTADYSFAFYRYGYWTSRGYVNSRTRQLADWTSQGLINSRMTLVTENDATFC